MTTNAGGTFCEALHFSTRKVVKRDCGERVADVKGNGKGGGCMIGLMTQFIWLIHHC